MKLIIKEYLSQLKESKELDWILPNLLLSIGIEPISIAQTGVRQFGVDVAAVGKFEEKEKSLYLFTIKQGDIGRSDWDSNNQSVRQSLNEILDVYLESHTREEHSKLKKKIILCSGGIIKQEVEENWKSYINKNSKKGQIEFEFWGGDRLSPLIEKYMFNEQLLSPEFQSLFRRTLALITDVDYDLSDYTLILKKTFLDKDFGDLKKSSSIKKVNKSLYSMLLCVNIIWSWSKQDDNIKNAIIAAEKTVLYCWQFLYNNNLTDNKLLINSYISLWNTLINLYLEYITKIYNHCLIEDGLISYSNSNILESLNIFEQLGLIALPGIEITLKTNIEKNEQLNENSIFIRELVKKLIKNHKAINSPLYDNHIVEISLAVFLLAMHDEMEFLEKWICEIIRSISFAYNNMDKYFPVSSDSFDDLVTLNIIGADNKSEFIKISTLIPILAHWCVAFNFTKAYEFILEVVKKDFSKVTLQMWYPDQETEKFIYSTNAAFDSGAVDAPLILPETLAELKNQILKVQKNTIKVSEISSIRNGYTTLPLISSRHFKTPILPLYIHLSILDGAKNV